MRRIYRALEITALVISLVAGIAALVYAGGHKNPERFYQQRWCAEHGGRMEVVLSDGTRCDCLTKDYAVEVDFGRKWAEGLGQAMHYARLTGKQPGVLLIIERPKDRERAFSIWADAKYFGFDLKVWTVDAEGGR